MKKFLLSMAAVAAMSFAANAQDWYLVGAYNGWSFEANPVKFEGTGDKLTASFDALQTGFKVIGTKDGKLDWNVNLCAPKGEKLKPGVEMTLVAGGDNIEYADDINSYNNVTLTLNPTTGAFTMTGEADTSLPDLFLAGSFQQPDAWQAGQAEYKFTEKDGVYTMTVEFPALEEGKTAEFKVVGNGWSPEFGATEGADWTFGGDVLSHVLDGNKNVKSTLVGKFDVKFVFDTKELTFTAAEGGIDAIESVDNVEAVYYNLQGVRVANPENGLFIKVYGDKVEKIIK